MSSFIAVDAVLLLPQEIEKLCIRINNFLVREYGSEIILDSEKSPPHISLFMGYFPVGFLSEVKKDLHQQSLLLSSQVVTLSSLRFTERPTGPPVVHFVLEANTVLSTLQKNVADIMETKIWEKGSSGAFFKDPEETISQSSINWVEDFSHTSSRAGYDPHITLGYGDEIETIDFPLRFFSTALAFYQLGNHCTCRKLLYKFPTQ